MMKKYFLLFGVLEVLKMVCLLMLSILRIFFSSDDSWILFCVVLSWDFQQFGKEELMMNVNLMESVAKN